jgi:hypothetical protein
LKKTSPGLITGLGLGFLCLTLALGLYIWAPDFTGFLDRSVAQTPLPVWKLLALLSVVNFTYAGVTYFLQRKIDQVAKEPPKPDE